jgi:intracellular septation protein
MQGANSTPYAGADAPPMSRLGRNASAGVDGGATAMMDLFHSGRLLVFDLASTFVFLIAYLLTNSVPLSVTLGMALGVAQTGWQLASKRPIGAMQWTSLLLVICLGAITLITNDPRFVMIKPSLIYTVVGVVMLKPGWMNRYLPAATIDVTPDIVHIFGFIWSGLMFFSAGLNVIVALNASVVTWASFMSVYGIFSKLGLFLIQYGTMRYTGFRRHAKMLRALPYSN